MAEFNEVMDALSVPMGQLIASVGESVAEAQGAMDRQTIDNFKAIYAVGEDALAEFRAIGYQPTWYAIPEVEAQLTVALSMAGASATRTIGATPVDASYSGRFGYNIRGASTLKFKIVPVPAPGTAADLQVVPSVTGQSFAQARAVLEERGLVVSAEGTPAEGTPADGAEVLTQQPEPGTVLPREGAVTVTVNVLAEPVEPATEDTP